MLKSQKVRARILMFLLDIIAFIVLLEAIRFMIHVPGLKSLFGLFCSLFICYIAAYSTMLLHYLRII